jgi:hypothetical protein
MDTGKLGRVADHFGVYGEHGGDFSENRRPFSFRKRYFDQFFPTFHYYYSYIPLHLL